MHDQDRLAVQGHDQRIRQKLRAAQAAELLRQQKVAIGARIAQHIAERGAGNIQPEVLQALDAEVRATQAKEKGANGKG